jgi:hypothetical protein
MRRSKFNGIFGFQRTSSVKPVFLMTILIITGAVFMLWNPVVAAEGKISGLLFGDFYYIASTHDSTSNIEGENGFWFRRIYFTYNATLDDHFSGRIRFETASKGDFATKAKMEPFIKDAYLKWKKSRHSILFGLSGTPTWGLIEKTWGYRSVEKTALDLQKFGSSRDIGVALKGNFDEEKKIGYHFMIGHGAGTSSETNRQKKAYLALDVKPTDGLVFQVYGDIEDGNTENTAKTTFQGFAALSGDPGRVGASFILQTLQLGVDSLNENVDSSFVIVSAFGVKKISDKVSAFARGDFNLDGNMRTSSISYIPIDPTVKNTIVIAGLDYTAGENVHIIPNVEVVLYSEEEGGPELSEEIIPRVTVYYKFK